MTMSLPPLFRPWYREDRNFEKNSEACIMFQEFPSHCRIAGIRYDLSVSTNAAMSLDVHSTFQLAGYYLPAHGSDAAEVIGTRSAMYTYAKRFIPRVISEIFHTEAAAKHTHHTSLSVHSPATSHGYSPTRTTSTTPNGTTRAPITSATSSSKTSAA